MTRILTTIAGAGALVITSVGSASAATCTLWRWWNCTRPTEPLPPTASVPEIDASAGLLTIAAVAAVLLIVWERRRRAH